MTPARTRTVTATDAALGVDRDLAVEVRADAPRQGVCIEVPFPGAMEVVDGSLSGACAHFEARPGLALIYVDTLSPGRSEFRFRLRPQYSGDFLVLPARAWLMYDPHVFGSTAPTRQIVAPR
ncbi:MAG: hypothetical protein HY719_10420 [Planctomycetes bacterium]|nr:hypothetical protein [Planctomycetota bacterium]